MKKSIKKVAFYSLCMLLGACSKTIDIEQESPAALYKKANSLFKKKSFASAAKLFEECEHLNPYAPYICQARIKGAYCFYRAQDYVNATRMLDTFILLHPGWSSMDYVHYLRALCYYNSIKTPEHDTETAFKAIKECTYIIDTFPNSPYVGDCQRKITKATEHIAHDLLLKGKFYQRNKSFLAALTIYNQLGFNYPHTPSGEESFFRSIECLFSFGAQDAMRIMADYMKKYYPKSMWLPKVDLLLQKFSSVKK